MTQHELRVRAVAYLRGYGPTGWPRDLMAGTGAAACEAHGLLLPSHLAGTASEIWRSVEPEQLAIEMDEWADLLDDPAKHARLFERAREAAGLTIAQAVAKACRIVPPLPRRARWIDTDDAERWLHLMEAGAKWPNLVTLQTLAEVYGVLPEYLTGYPLQAPNEVVSKLFDDMHATDERMANALERARMIGGYAPSARK